MSSFQVSWKYEIITQDGESKFELFEFDDCLKLELSF